MTEEHKRKLQEARIKAAEMKAQLNQQGINSFAGPSIDKEEFIFKGEYYKRLWYNEEKNLAVFRRSNYKTNFLIAYEVVSGKGIHNKYPKDEDFGEYGQCYTGNDEHCKRMIKERHNIDL